MDDAMKGKGLGLPLSTLFCLTALVGCGADSEQRSQTISDTFIETKSNHLLCRDLLNSLGIDAALEICTSEAKMGDANAQYTLANLYLDGTVAKDDWQQAFPWLLLAADQGHFAAQMQVARALQSGRGVAKNEEQAFFWIKRAADGNYPEAQVALGQCYLQGLGVAKNETLAIQCLTDSARKGNSEAMYQLAQKYLQPTATQNLDEAQSLLSMAAENGHALAMFSLARLYHEGTVFPKDDSKALYWYSQANSKDHPQAEYELAMLLLKGTWQMNESPIHLLLKSAEQDYVPAQLTLAKLYQQGQKVPKNDRAAFDWYVRAAKAADPEAFYHIGLCFVYGQLMQPKNRDLGVEYLKQAAEAGYMPAQYTLASLYLEGQSVLDDRQQAMDYLIQAANNGWVDAQLKLAQTLMQFSLPQYDKAAFHWALKAGKQQHAEALFMLANCYYDGIGTEIDYQQAFKIFQRLAERDHFLAQYKVGQMLLEGQGSDKDVTAAKKWLTQAAMHHVNEAKEALKLYFNETDESLAQSSTELELTEWLQSESGSAPMVFQKGMNYLYAKQGVEQNIQAGMNLLHDAAEKAYLPAQRELAIIYENGLFGYQNAESIAYDWYTNAAKSGDDYSLYRLANMSYNGKGVLQNPVQAYAYANMAANKGNEEAIVLLNDLVKKLNENEIAVAEMIIKTEDPQSNIVNQTNLNLDQSSQKLHLTSEETSEATSE